MSWSIQAASINRFREAVDQNIGWQTYDEGKEILRKIGELAEKFVEGTAGKDGVYILESHGHIDAISVHGNASVMFRVIPK